MDETPNKEQSRLTIDITPDLHKALKIAAAERGVSMRQLVIEAITEKYAPNIVPKK